MPRQNSLPGISVADHSNLGKDWENEIKTVNEWYRRQGWADIVKNPSEWEFIGEREYRDYLQTEPAMVAVTGDGRFMRRTPSDVDYSGGGRGFGKHFSICFDAKTTGQIPVPLKLFKAHQIARVLESARCGSVAGFLLRLSAVRRVFWLPAKFVRVKEDIYIANRRGRRARPGTASFTLEEMEKKCPEIQRNPQNGLWDYLPVVLRNS